MESDVRSRLVVERERLLGAFKIAQRASVAQFTTCVAG